MGNVLNLDNAMISSDSINYKGNCLTDCLPFSVSISVDHILEIPLPLDNIPYVLIVGLRGYHAYSANDFGIYLVSKVESINFSRIAPIKETTAIQSITFDSNLKINVDFGTPSNVMYSLIPMVF